MTLRSRSARRVTGSVIVLVGITALDASVSAARPLAAEPPSSEVAGVVVAQGAMPLGAAAYQWSVVAASVTEASPAPAPAAAPGFVVVTSGSLLVTNAAGVPVALVGEGESAPVPAAATIRAAPGSGDAAYELLTLVAAGGVGTPFTPGAGTFDVSLSQATLPADGAWSVPDGAFPALVMSTAASIAVSDSVADPQPISAGGRSVDGAATIVNEGTEPATVLVAAIGASIDVLAPAGGIAIPTAQPGAVPSTSAPAQAEPTPAPQAPGPATPAPGPTTTAAPDDAGTAPADSDGDGLSDADEASKGTDPNNPDTDGDGLTDGTEVQLGINPTNQHSDQDGIPDSQEVAIGTNPNTIYSDADALSDDEELFEFGTDPRNPDTDGDNCIDHREIRAYYTDPLDAASVQEACLDDDVGL